MPARVTEVEVPSVPELQVRVESDRGTMKPKARTVRYLSGLGAGVTYGVHSSCLKNTVRAITERVLYVRSGERLSKPPQPEAGVFKRLGSLRDRVMRRLPSTPNVVALDDYPELYTGRKKKTYRAAVDSLKTRGLTVADSYVSTFVKAEKVNFSKKGDPAPRAIQPRSTRYNAMVGRYLKLFEKVFMGAIHREFGYPVIMKGLNAQQVGGWMKKHWDSFRHPVAIGLDASRFDQHVSYDALEFEHSIYNGHFRSSELKWLLKMQLNNRGIARCDGYRIDYRVRGVRMSGDINTGLGNCLLMTFITICYLEELGIKFRLANNGDDCVIFLEQSDLGRLGGINRWYRDFGFTIVQEAPVYVLERVEFCQFQPVLTSTGWRMVRNPRTAMSKDCVSLVGWDTEVAIRAWAEAVGTCGGALTSGVPVWEPWYAMLRRCGGISNSGVQDRVEDCGMSRWARGVEKAVVTPEARVSFWRAFGIPPDHQCALEDFYRGIHSFESYTPVVTEYTYPCDILNPITHYGQS